MPFNPETAFLHAIKNPVSYKVPWKETDIVDQAMFGLVLQAIEAKGLTKAHFFVVGDELREVIYDRVHGKDMHGDCAVGIRYTQFLWMQRICEDLKLEWPTAAMRPGTHSQPPDYAYSTSMAHKLKRQLKIEREEEAEKAKLEAANIEAPSTKNDKRSPGDAGPSRPRKLARQETSTWTPNIKEEPTDAASMASFGASLTARPGITDSEPEPATGPKLAATIAAPSTVRSDDKRGSTSAKGKESARQNSPAARVQAPSLGPDGRQLTILAQPAPMSTIWPYLKDVQLVPYPVYDDLPVGMYGPYDILFPNWCDWQTCWVDGQAVFKGNLSEAVQVEEYPLVNGYYKIVVSQRAGTKFSLGNIVATFECWEGLRGWSEYLHFQGEQLVGHYFSMLYRHRAHGRHFRP